MAARSKPENAILCQPMFVTATESSKSLHESVSACGANSAISRPGARRRVKSLWERDFCVKCDEAHCGARVLGPLGTRVPDSRASPDHFWDGGKRRTLGFPQEDQSIGTGWR